MSASAKGNSEMRLGLGSKRRMDINLSEEQLCLLTYTRLNVRDHGLRRSVGTFLLHSCEAQLTIEGIFHNAHHAMVLPIAAAAGR